MKNVCQFDRKFFPNLNSDVCPYCGGLLENIEINEWEYEKDDISSNSNDVASNYDQSIDTNEWTDFSPTSVPSNTTLYSPNSTHKSKKTDIFNKSHNSGTIEVDGIIMEVNSGREHRWFISKIIDSIVAGQNFGDDVQFFVIQNNESSQIFNVVAYGKVSGHGAIASIGQHVQVVGYRTKNGVIFCNQMLVDLGGIQSQVKFYNGNKDDYYSNQNYHNPFREIRPKRNRLFIILVTVVSLALAYAFIPVFRVFVVVWAVLSLITLVFIKSFFRRYQIQSPLSILAIGLILSLILFNVGGIGTVVSSVLSALIPIVGPICVLLIVLYLLVK